MSNNFDQDFGSEDEEDFNPQPEVGSDDEEEAKQELSPKRDDEDVDGVKEEPAAKDEDDEQAEEDEDEGAAGRDDEDDEDDEDEDDEEDEDEEEAVGHPRKRRRRDRRNQFLDVEAEVDEDEEEEAEDDEDVPDEVHPDDLLELPAGAERDDRKHRELDRQRDLAASMDAEKQAAALRERYGRSRAAASDSAIVPQRLLLPSVDDPHIFRVKWGVMAGNIYCEAKMLSDVTIALEGLQNVYMGTKPMMIGINEMPDLLRTQKTKQLDPGMRTRGADPLKRKRPGFGATTGPRPPQRKFNEAEAKKRHGRFLSKGTTGGLSTNNWVYMNDTYVDGFLEKEFKVNHLQTEDVNPKLEEVTQFASSTDDGTENLDLSALAETIKSNTSGAFLPGDNVEIYQGEQRGVTGKAVAVHSDIVKIAVRDGPLRGQTIDAPIKGLRKLFRDGDHVKIIGGKYLDEVGMVVKIVEDRVTILTDATQQEITVFSKDLREASDSGGVVGASKYDLHDLVQLDAATVGCVIKVDRDSLRVLDQTGSVRVMLPSNISNKLERRKNAVATDREGAEIRIDDTIKEYGGEGKTGRVLHLKGNYVFAHNREAVENAGVFVARTNGVTTVVAKGGRAVQSDLTRMNPAMQRNGGKPMPQAMPLRVRWARTDSSERPLLPEQAHTKVIWDTTDTHARIEMYTKKNIVTVPKANLSIRDPNTGEVIQSDALRPGRPGARPVRVGEPSTEVRRLAAELEPPPEVQMAEGHPPGSKQVAVHQLGNRAAKLHMAVVLLQVARPLLGRLVERVVEPHMAEQLHMESQLTNPYHNPMDAGNKTPAWNANAGGKTPAYGGSLDAPTPGVYSAPTPGAFDNPTPGARYGGAPTPGVYSAPTPGETPGGWTAETPAADDGPTYD
ncbi:transcription elongation factor spt5 [Taxawa tesnikishii (nom. ined.)]|nr:transcription elongation factor spt5 [Dothideales sp. JES 119]